MVAVTQRSRIKWLEPSPLWADAGRWMRLPAQQFAETPMILRFANDNFMEELLALLDQTPQRLPEWEAQPETWREPMPAPQPVYAVRAAPARERLSNGHKLLMRRSLPAVANAPAPLIDMSRAAGTSADLQAPLKLYQPAQNRYYLVAASLASETAGYPDHKPAAANNERATFVVRAVVSGRGPENDGEYAFVATPAGKAWRKVSPYPTRHFQNRILMANEEQLPMFPLNYRGRCGQYRQVLGGFIPVGKREEWMGAAAASSPAPTADTVLNPVPAAEGGPRHLKEMFFAQVIEPWRALIEQAQYSRDALNTDRDTFPNFTDRWNAVKAAHDQARALRAVRDRIQTGSWYVLLEFANYLDRHLPNVWNTLVDKQPASALTAPEQALVRLLQQTTLGADFYAALAIDQFLTARNDFVENNLWEELKALWVLENKLGLTGWPDTPRDLVADLVDRLAAEAFDSLDRARFQRVVALIGSDAWFTLLDLAGDLARHVPQLKRLALAQIAESALSADERAARQRLSGLKQTDLSGWHNAIGVADLADRRIRILHRLSDALAAVKTCEENLESLTAPFDRSAPPEEENVSPVIDPRWPDFLFPLADPDTVLAIERSAVVPPAVLDVAGLQGIDILLARLKALAERIDALLPAPQESPGRRTDIGATPLLDHRQAHFVIRCVFERPNCGPLFPALLSQATRRLEMAPFFDPDAPARPVRIALPMDISPAGLRKYKKNAVFLISDMLCGQISKIKKLTLADLVLSVLPWPFHKDLPKVGPTGPCKSAGDTIGMFCSLSIPIVTLVALILMIIMVQLFDLFFRWMPYLFVCLPIPGFKGKDDA